MAGLGWNDLSVLFKFGTVLRYMFGEHFNGFSKVLRAVQAVEDGRTCSVGLFGRRHTMQASAGGSI